MNYFTVLDHSGDFELRWEHNDLSAREDARKAIADLKAQVNGFFLVTGDPIDEVSVGAGALNVRRIDPEQLTEVAAPEEPAGEPVRGKRGRPAGDKAIAVRPMAGG